MSEALSYLTQEQRESLNDLPFAILLPASLPSGWKVEEIDLHQDEEGASFALKLVSGDKTCAFLTSNEGIGDAVPGVKQSMHKHSEYGAITVEHEEDGSTLSDWIEVEGGWSAVGGNGLNEADLDQLIPQLICL
jgi:uncharacterized protein YbdZ (MbtH family)